MRIKSLKRSTARKKLILIITAIVLVGLISTFVILEMTGITHFINNPVSKTVDQNKEADTNSSDKQKLIESDPNNSTATPAEHTPSDISLSASHEADGSVAILTRLKNYSDGTCDLTIESNNNAHTQTAPVIYSPAFSTCAGFSVPANTLANGTWQITLSVTSKGKVNTNTISVEIQ